MKLDYTKIKQGDILSINNGLYRLQVINVWTDQWNTLILPCEELRIDAYELDSPTHFQSIKQLCDFYSEQFKDSIIEVEVN